MNLLKTNDKEKVSVYEDEDKKNLDDIEEPEKSNNDSNKHLFIDHESNKLLNEIEKLQEQIHNLESENDILIDVNIKKENLESQIITYEVDINEYKLKLNSYEMKIDKYKSKCRKYKLIINKLKHEIDKFNLISENANLKFQLNILEESQMKIIDSTKSKEYKSGINENHHPSSMKLQNFNGEDEQNVKFLDNNYSLFTPIGFENSNGNCFFNCVVQQFYSCKDFKNELIKYHITSQIINSNAEDGEKIFVNNFCKLMKEISNMNERKSQEYVSNIQKYFSTSSSGDDVHKCFMNILTMLSDVTKKPVNFKESTITHTTPEKSFEIFRNQHEGFVFDLFYGQMAIKLVCIKCNYELSKRFQLFKSIPLPVPKATEMIPLETVIKNFLEESTVDIDEKMDCKCPGGSTSLYSITEFTHMPSYLFIYLNRGSYFENDEKNNTFISCEEIFNFQTDNSFIKYRLISVIDHIGDNNGGHYYAKSCFETDQWWMLNDSFVNLIEDKKSIVTKQAIVFLFKKLSE